MDEDDGNTFEGFSIGRVDGDRAAVSGDGAADGEDRAAVMGSNACIREVSHQSSDLRVEHG